MTMDERDRLIVVEQKLDAILHKMDTFTEGQKDHETRIRCLETKPSKRWESVVSSIISALVGAGIGAAIASMFK